MEANELKSALEAILFVSHDPVSLAALAEALGEPEEAVQGQLDEIRRVLDANVGGFTMEQAAGGWRPATRPEHEPVLKKYFARKGEGRLSIAALETLAIIAYRQPITAPEISELRGVNSSAVLKTLFDKKLITTAGKKPVVGTPFFYRTTKDFLVRFGLNDLAELPKPEEIDEDLAGEEAPLPLALVPPLGNAAAADAAAGTAPPPAGAPDAESGVEASDDAAAPSDVDESPTETAPTEPVGRR